MKKLGKNNTSEANTIQAYSCECSCSCSCMSGTNDELVAGVRQEQYNDLGGDVKTISFLN